MVVVPRVSRVSRTHRYREGLLDIGDKSCHPACHCSDTGYSRPGKSRPDWTIWCWSLLQLACHSGAWGATPAGGSASPERQKFGNPGFALRHDHETSWKSLYFFTTLSSCPIKTRRPSKQTQYHLPKLNQQCLEDVSTGRLVNWKSR